MIRFPILESLTLYKDVFARTIDPAVIFDKESKISYVNKSLLEIGNYDFKEIKGESVDVLVPGKERARIKNIVKEVLEKKNIFRNFHTFLLTKNKKEIPVALTALPLSEEKKLIGGLAIFVDIRQLKGLLEGLGRARSELERRVRERTKELEKKTSELEKAKKALEEAKNILEVKVKARTKELEELNETLEEKVEQRTKELQEKVDELNKWYKLTVGRELKMIELKEEVERFKKRARR